MRDTVVLSLLVVSFATLLTTHVLIAGRMSWAIRPRYRGLLALLVPPLAPWWAWEQRWRRMAGVWLGALAVYTVALIFALQ